MPYRDNTITSIYLSRRLVERVDLLARKRGVSRNCVYVEAIQAAVEAGAGHGDGGQQEGQQEGQQAKA